MWIVKLHQLSTSRYNFSGICPNQLFCDCNWIRTQNHVVLKWTLNHLAKLTKWLSCVLSTYLYGAFDCMFLSCHVRIWQSGKCGFNLKCVRDMTRTYSQLFRHYLNHIYIYIYGSTEIIALVCLMSLAPIHFVVQSK